MKRKKTLGSFLLYIHQLPQNRKARKIIKKNKVYQIRHYKDVDIYYLERNDIGESLGRYIILPKTLKVDYSTALLTETIKHCYGHCQQSKILGWLYIPLVIYPARILNGLAKVKWLERWYRKKYYSKYPEKWADKLGKVDRNWIRLKKDYINLKGR